jgi:hypothetical protein
MEEKYQYHQSVVTERIDAFKVELFGRRGIVLHTADSTRNRLALTRGRTTISECNSSGNCKTLPRYDRLRKAGMLTVKEMAALLGLTPQWVKIWNRHGLICGHACNDKNDCLYEHPGDNPPRKAQGVKLSRGLSLQSDSARRRAVDRARSRSRMQKIFISGYLTTGHWGNTSSREVEETPLARCFYHFVARKQRQTMG